MRKYLRFAAKFYFTGPILAVWFAGLLGLCAAAADRDPYLAAASVIVLAVGHGLFAGLRRGVLWLIG